MKLQVGKRYKTRNGKTVVIHAYTPEITLSSGIVVNPSFPFKGAFVKRNKKGEETLKGYEIWGEDGNYSAFGTNENDLIEEV